MPDNIQTEEKEQVKRLLKRWINYDAKWCIFTAIIVVLLICCANIPNSFPISFILMPVTALACYFLWRWSLQRFIRRLSKEDRELLVRVAKDDAYTHPNFDSLLKACKINPQIEYLRPSQQTQSDTLLRAAAYTEERTQDQLLRPTDTPRIPHP